MSILLNVPLAERVRPQTLDEYMGQEHLLGKNAPFRNLLAKGLTHSMILWGPPGTGKTTLAYLIAKFINAEFIVLNAINSGVKEIREVLDKAKHYPKTILFIDEIHRFNKSQQDSLLNAVEKGIITLIGATTENPSFEIINALLSRCHVYTLYSLTESQLIAICQQALATDEYLKQKNCSVAQYDALIEFSGGDARKLLNLLALVIENLPSFETPITNELVKITANLNVTDYDKSGENHYDISSALIKSIRGSDPNAALYWLARMLDGGEDLRFIARRLVIAASEDIGNANPAALPLAVACFQAIDFVGMPEAEIILGQTVTYLATSAKSNASYVGIKSARQLVRETGNLSVPLHLRNAPTTLMKKMDYGKNYQYPHNFKDNFVIQEYLPEKLKNTLLYNMGNNVRENEMRNRMKLCWGTKYNY